MDSSLLQARLFPGLAIKIQRSNGLIHSANIRTVNLEKSCVSVEWTEGGATKGKEIDFDDVAAINQNSYSFFPYNPKDNLPLQENVTVQKQKRRAVSLRGRSTRMSTVPEVRITTQENDMEVELPASANSRKQFSVPSEPSCPAVAEIPLTMVSEEVEEQVHSVQGSSSANPVNSVRRKSCIVKEMEKMKNKREEKRAQNSEMRVKRAQEYDNSFPNWEFSRMIKEFRATLECHPLTVTDPHPLKYCPSAELAKKEIDVISVPSKCVLLVHEPKLKVDLTKYLENQAFCFDFAFDETASNEVVYRLVPCLFGHCGNTHTMGGDLCGKAQNASKGIYAMASRDVFLLKNQPRYRNLGLEVCVTFFEIYNGKVAGREPFVYAVGAPESFFVLLCHRTSGQTFANSSSSRSHACFQILLRAKGRVHGKFSLVDLAGNERGADTSSADRQTRMEGAEINKSLLALKECIRALGQNKAHTPFRESKLTQVLRDSFIGENSRTCMIAMISPGISSCEYTLNTLRYADRVKELSPHSGPSGEQPTQMETEEMEASSNGALSAGNEEEELSSQMSSFNEAMTQIRELEERAMEELKEIIQEGPGWLELCEMAEQPDYDLETFVNKAECALAQQAKHFSALQDVLKALRLAMQLEEQASKQISIKKRPH
uniref:Kinesin-like protein n=1 Tax=Balaenoptera musculus TaxID=9771 RepID=A0A8C0I0U7_BALMU